ncbi:MAG: RagB/SusD family nutrient uptake outer membrane protein [Prolixibacteraceae bacterium]|nr:RagB/SusD family nutrient uptake outer membrane protein [Prolixibacteraceae bacterium]
MKNLKNAYLFFIAAVMLLASCSEDILDLKPTDKLSDATVWDDLKLVDVYVNQSYNSLALTSWGSNAATATTFGWGSHQGVYGYWSGAAVDEIFEYHDRDGWCIKSDWILRGELSSTNLSSIGRWKKNYSLIRAINTYFEKESIIKGDAAEIKKLSAQMYALRAWNYIHLVKNYGGVPIITKVFSTADTEFQEVRKTLDECVTFIMKDLDEAIANLPLTYGAADAGRVTKGAAMAMKANFLLWLASPLNNPTNDQAKWTAASNAAKAVIDMPQYALYKPALYENIFIDKANSEVILAKYINGTAENYGATHFESTTVNRDLAPNSYGGWGMGTPIQNVVDDFEMADGTPFNWSNPVHAAAPYANRDPRFDATIFYDGRMHRGETVDTYEGGKDNPIGAKVEPTNATQTGYYLRKFVDPAWNTKDWNYTGMVIFIRLSEIYLNYAEAQNVLGNDAEALKYVNMIRSRAGMPNISGSGTILHDKIRHERRIELAFEGQRYYDLRRWKILDQGMGDAIGMRIVKNSDGTKTYSKKTIQKRIYTEKVYWQPIPLTEIQKNAKLTQNPGY